MPNREVLVYYGDGIRAPEKGELVGRRVNLNGKTGAVVESDALSITVEWDFVHSRDCRNWFCRLIWWLCGRR
jgi:hypothetical protein